MTTPSDGYRAAVHGLAVHDRSGRGLLRVGGRAPVRMLHGILTASIPRPERAVGPGVRAGRASYSTLLTPKGRMVSDLRVLRVDAAEEGDAANGREGGLPPAGTMRGPALAPVGGGGTEEILLDVAGAGTAGVLEQFGRFLPPRFATVEDLSDDRGLLTVLGPGAAPAVALHAAGLRVGEEELHGLEEYGYLAVDTGAGTSLRIVRTAEVAAPAFDLLADRRTLDGIRRVLLDAGAAPLGEADWEVLRVEAGRPAFGVDMDEDTIPVEAGLAERAIDHAKGCYTGQEVIVRIRDRGHVNRSLRGLVLSGPELPDRGTGLRAPEERGERSAGVLTSVVASPRMGHVALGYVRREVSPGGTVRVGEADGPAATVVDLDEGWGPA